MLAALLRLALARLRVALLLLAALTRFRVLTLLLARLGRLLVVLTHHISPGKFWGLETGLLPIHRYNVRAA
jgi:hypothetical protein